MNLLKYVASTSRRCVAVSSRACSPGKALRRLRDALVVFTFAHMAFGQIDREPKIEGVSVSIKTLANFRGAVPNQLQGYGLVVGLGGTGDTKKSLTTQKAVVNLLLQAGIEVDPSQSEVKNVALVALSAELPPYARPGGRVDVTVSTIGDCTSLRGGQLLFSNLRYPGVDDTLATVAGAVTVGGVSASAGGNSKTSGFTTVGTMPGAAIVLKGVDTKTVTEDGKLYLDLLEPDPIVTRRIEEVLNRKYPEFHALSAGAGSVQIDLPQGMSENTAQARVFGLGVIAPQESKVVIDERTGTIVIGGDVRIGPCVIAQGNLSIKVTSQPFVSQPEGLSKGQTVVATQKTVETDEGTAEIAAVRSNTSVADLATIFQALRLKASDIVNILRTMHDEGALKAKLEIR